LLIIIENKNIEDSMKRKRVGRRSKTKKKINSLTKINQIMKRNRTNLKHLALKKSRKNIMSNRS
jgi:hypothetical protein